MIIMTAANNVSPTANSFGGEAEPWDLVTWTLLITALPSEAVCALKKNRKPLA
jgi:hypothetical protein